MVTIKTIIKSNNEIIEEKNIKVDDSSIKSVNSPYYVVVHRAKPFEIKFFYLEEIVDVEDMVTKEFDVKYGVTTGRFVSLWIKDIDISDSNWSFLRERIKTIIEKRNTTMLNTLLLGYSISKTIFNEVFK